jgi:hypothetical protein
MKIPEAVRTPTCTAVKTTWPIEELTYDPYLLRLVTLSEAKDSGENSGLSRPYDN